MRNIVIKNREIGEGFPVFVVAEVGITCNGDLATAKKLIEAAAKSGADAIKFMMINPDEFMSDKSIMYHYTSAFGSQSVNMYEMFQELMFGEQEWLEIQKCCRQHGIIFYATVDNLPDVARAQRLDLPLLKLSSWDAGHISLIKAMAQVGKPIEIDLGPVTLSEVTQMIDWIREEGNEDIILMSCSHAKRPEEVNLKVIEYLKKTFALPVGYSADDQNICPDMAAIALGCHVIEKRLTLDEKDGHHHHIYALEPNAFKDWVEQVRLMEKMLGEPIIKPSQEDLRQKKEYFVSLVSKQDVAEGTELTEEMFVSRRPGTGIAPANLDRIVGRKLRCALKKNELIQWSHLKEEEAV